MDKKKIRISPAHIDEFNYAVINLDRSINRMEHYPDIYHRHSAYDGINEPPCLSGGLGIQKLITRYNTRDVKRKCIYGCIRSHMALLWKIYTNRLHKVVIMEDDNDLIDNDIIEKLDEAGCDAITYLGGWIVPPLIKDIKRDMSDIKDTFKEGLNTIDYDKFRVLTCRCYYIPTPEHARDMFFYLLNRKKWRAMDIMMCDSKIPKYLWYPAVGLQRLNSESQIMNKKITTRMETY